MTWKYIFCKNPQLLVTGKFFIEILFHYINLIEGSIYHVMCNLFLVNFKESANYWLLVLFYLLFERIKKKSLIFVHERWCDLYLQHVGETRGWSDNYCSVSWPLWIKKMLYVHSKNELEGGFDFFVTYSVVFLDLSISPTQRGGQYVCLTNITLLEICSFGLMGCCLLDFSNIII